MLKVFNNSRFTEWLRCKRKFYWRYIMRLVHMSMSNALAFGTAWHEVMAAFYAPGEENRNVEELQVIWTNTYRELANADNLDEYTSDLATGPKLVEQYVNNMPWEEDFTTVEVESTFCVSIGLTCYACGVPYSEEQATPGSEGCKCGAPIFYLAGTADIIGVRRGKFVLLDHKTAMSMGKQYSLGHENSFAMIGYCYGIARTLGHIIRKYAINTCKKLKTAGKDSKQCPDCRNGKNKKKTCTNCNFTGSVPCEPPQPFYREWYNIKTHDFQKMKDNRLALAQEINQEIEKFKRNPAQAFPMNDKHCPAFNGCDYIELCWSDCEKWWAPDEILLTQFISVDEDYVDNMIQEERY
jgi:hypothetical protein